jgi:hypothetical protein
MIRMFDSTRPEDLPKGAAAYIGYVGGNPGYTQYPVAKRMFPKAHILGLAVASRYDAEGVDVEKGDVPNSLVASWVKRQMARGVKKPVVYTSASNAGTLLALLHNAGIQRDQIRLLTAHYNFRPHICGPKTCGYPQADGTQWTDRSGGHHLDESLLNDDFFGRKIVTPQNPDAHIYLRDKGEKEGRYEPLTKKGLALRLSQAMAGKFGSFGFDRGDKH